MMTRWIAGLLAAAALAAAAAPASAQTQARIGIGFGVGFLPLFIADELDLVEKHAKAAGLNVTASYQRFSGSAAMQDAVLSGSVDMGAYGVPAMLIAWEKAKGTRNQIFGVAGVTTLPLVLVTNNASVKSLAEFGPKDRIAMPALISPQMYVLQMAAEKAFGEKQHDRLRNQVVALPHPEALNAVTSGGTEVTAYFSSAPFTQIALRNPKIHAVLSSADVFGGRASFLVLAATKGYLDANAKMAEVMKAALAEAAALIKDDPKRAAEIYLKVEPSKILDAAQVEALLRELAGDFGIEVQGVKAFADFMGRIGQLKNPPASWRDVVSPVLHDTPSS